MTLSEELAWRGLIKDRTFADVVWLNEPKTFYHGYDAASADSFTVGNLAALILDRRFINAGWKAVILAGGATSLIGDPGGKAEERELKSREEIAKNIAAIKVQISQLFAGETFEMVDNHDWLKDIRYLDFLRQVGKNFSMSELMQREFVAERIREDGSGISYAEFSYSLVQGYDYWHLYKTRGAVLQIGGSDQWGNMLSGVSLVRKKEGQEVHALSMPLVVNKVTGVKFGKSESGAVWLSPGKTTPTDFYQFWINASDKDVEDYLKIFTLLSRDEIESVLSQHKEDPSKRLAQKVLAEAVTAMVHGRADEAESVTKYLTSQASLEHISDDELAKIKQQIPNGKARPGDSIIELLSDVGLASSNSEARRLLASGAVYINGQKVDRENLDDSDFQNGRLLLRRSKAYRDSALVELK